jgi:predicted amidophosphoribosyltransferase
MMLRHALALLAPPLCAVCAAAATPREPLCARCAAALGQARPSAFPLPAADWTLAAADYDGTARAMVTGLKFGGRLALAGPMAAAIAAAAGHRLDRLTVVPVPPAPRRRRHRGFDPAQELAAALCRQTGLPLRRCLGRADGPRQVGRARHERLASPPLISPTHPTPERSLLIDDVVTTGATLTACTTTLRAAGAAEVGAVTFARTK